MNIDEKFLDELKSVLESKVVPAKSSDGTVSQVLLLDLSKSKWELPNEEGLPLPNKMLTKIFDYLDFQEISNCAQVSQQFNNVSELTWKSRDKITIQGKEVPSEFLTFLLEKGIKELRIFGCKILPPKSKFTPPLKALKLKSVLFDDECWGYHELVTNALKSHPMERIAVDFSQLKSLTLPQNFRLNRESLGYIVESCVNLEELDMSYHDHLLDSDLDYLSVNLAPSTLKLDLCGVENYDDHALCKLVKRCSNLQTLDISCTKVTWYGLSAIIDNLPCVEYLSVPSGIGKELGLLNEIDMVKMEKLRSMKQLKCLILTDSDGYPDMDLKYHKILVKEMPHLIRTADDYFYVGWIDNTGHKQVEFLSPADY